MRPIPIDRGFHRIAAGQIHYRIAGTCQPGGPPPLLLAHGGPGSSAGLVPLIAALAETRRVIAPDMMGNGDSDPPPCDQPDIGFYADCLIEFLDGMGIGTVDAYGHHTGAQVVCELAIAQPDRVRRLVLDGLGLFPDDLRAELIAHYAKPIVPLASGDHMLAIWDFVDNLTRYFPYYRRDDDHRIVPALSIPPDATMNIARDVIRAWPTVHIAYRAAFAHRLADRLPLVTAPTLVFETEGDPLARYAGDAAAQLRDGRPVRVTRLQRAAAIADWLIAD